MEKFKVDFTFSFLEVHLKQCQALDERAIWHALTTRLKKNSEGQHDHQHAMNEKSFFGEKVVIGRGEHKRPLPTWICLNSKEKSYNKNNNG